QNFAPDTVHPVLHDYTNLPAPGQAPPQPSVPQSAAPQTGGVDQQPMYLIAMKDHTIYPALAYWIDQDTLNYVTVQGHANRVSLSLVDRDLSQRLNDERGLQFRLPPSR